MKAHIVWCGTPLDYCPGDTVALALLRAGVLDLGPGPAGSRLKVLCGMGQCQGCLVRDGRGLAREACLSRCSPGALWHTWASDVSGEQDD